MQKDKKYIGVFDSGFGGINILRGIVKKLSQYNYLYLGDTARAPYGPRSKEVIYAFTRQAVDFLLTHNCELIIIACNTSSSEALRKIQQDYVPKKYPGKKVLGVLIPAVEEAVTKTKNNKVGVIATEGTVRSKTFVKELTKLNPKIKTFQQACPLLVPLVEAGEQNTKSAQLILATYLKPLKEKGIDTLILGCTHYGILESKIKKLMGPKVQIISEASVVAKKLKAYLKHHPEIDQKLAKGGKTLFYSTDLTKKFTELGSQFFGKKITAHKATLL
jgi:glutamate racemase